MKFLLRIIDSSIYILLMPVGVLYVFPRFFMQLEKLFFNMSVYPVLATTGSVLMIAGGVLALTCAIIIFLNKYGSVVPFYTPTVIIKRGPYAIVRHPMMWALFNVLLGEVLMYSSAGVLLWLLIWIRFSQIYIGDYEEPYLIRTFGKEYLEYMKYVPRWVPSIVLEVSKKIDVQIKAIRVWQIVTGVKEP